MTKESVTTSKRRLVSTYDKMTKWCELIALFIDLVPTYLVSLRDVLVFRYYSPQKLGMSRHLSRWFRGAQAPTSTSLMLHEALVVRTAYEFPVSG